MMGHEDVGAPDRRPHPGSPADKGKPEATQGRKATGPHEVSRVAEVETGDGAASIFGSVGDRKLKS